MRNRQVFREFALQIEGLKNATRSKLDAGILQAYRERLQELTEELPSGSGFDNGSLLDIDNSTPERLEFSTDYHHMTEGYYDGWSSYRIVVTPSLGHEINVEVTDTDDRLSMAIPDDSDDTPDMLDYVATAFIEALTAEIAVAV